MHTSANLSLSSPTLPAARRSGLVNLIVALLDHTIKAAERARHVLLTLRKPRAWREDLPWNVGMDHLGETGHPPWVPRGW